MVGSSGTCTAGAPADTATTHDASEAMEKERIISNEYRSYGIGKQECRRLVVRCIDVSPLTPSFVIDRCLSSRVRHMQSFSVHLNPSA